MAKDPAFLFYASDFLTGTMFMTDEQVGVYIRMLCAQHQHGGRIDTNVLQTYCGRITNGDTVMAKFTHDETGSYNERLEIEMNKRKEKSVKAAESVKKRWDKAKDQNTYERNTNVIRSVNENENRNEDVIEDKKERAKKFSRPELSEVQTFMQERNMVAGGVWQPDKVSTEAKKFWNYYESNGWKVGKNSMKDWQAAARNWMNNANNFTNDKNGKQSDTDQYIAQRKALLFGTGQE